VKLVKFFTLIFAVFVEKLYKIRLQCLILRRRYDKNNLIQYGRRRIAKIVNISRSYDVSYIFKMTAVRHLEFLKIQILDTFSMAESKSGSSPQIWSESDDRRPRYCDKTEIQYDRRRHAKCTSGLLFDTCRRLWRQDVSA